MAKYDRDIAQAQEFLSRLQDTFEEMVDEQCDKGMPLSSYAAILALAGLVNDIAHTFNHTPQELLKIMMDGVSYPEFDNHQ